MDGVADLMLYHHLNDPTIESPPLAFLFQAPPLPTPSQANYGMVDAFLQKYKDALRRQIAGRTSLLDGVLTTLENCAKTIQQDFSYIISGGDEIQWVPVSRYLHGVDWGGRELSEQLKRAYTPAADSFCHNLVEKLKLVAERHADDNCEPCLQRFFLYTL